MVSENQQTGVLRFPAQTKKGANPRKGRDHPWTTHNTLIELDIALQKAGYTVRPEESGLLPIEWNGRPLCRVTEGGGIRFRTDDTTDPAAEVARAGSQTLPVWSGST